MLTNQQIEAKYGKPGDVENHFALKLPFPFYLDWDLKTSVKHIICHKLIADRLKAALEELKACYGVEKIHELGIDQFGGCFNHRPKRGCETQYAAAIAKGDKKGALQYLSTHSWSIALDLDPDRNKLRETKRTARFARPDYKDMIAIFYRNGFLNYGVEKDFDYMHFEIRE